MRLAATTDPQFPATMPAGRPKVTTVPLRPGMGLTTGHSGAPIDLSGWTYLDGSLRIIDPLSRNLLAGYTVTTGDSIELIGGSGITAGRYTIASKLSDNALTITGSAGSDSTADVEGYVYGSLWALPRMAGAEIDVPWRLEVAGAGDALQLTDRDGNDLADGAFVGPASAPPSSLGLRFGNREGKLWVPGGFGARLADLGAGTAEYQIFYRPYAR